MRVRWAAPFERALEAPAVVGRRTDAGLRASWLPPDRTASRMAAGQETIGLVVEEANIRAE